MNKKNWKETLIGLGLALVPLGFGAWMIASPKLMNGADPTAHGHRHVLLKYLLMWIWGTPAGVILVLIGLLFLWAVFLPRAPDDDDEDDD